MDKQTDRRTILIAEDDKDIAELLRLYLMGEGYAVETAENGVVALRILEKNAVDLAIVDIMMPAMNGYELIQAIRRDRNIPILVISAKGSDGDKIIGLNLGADDYVVKPFNPLEVCARVQSLLRRYYELGADENLKHASLLKVGDLELDTEAMSATVRGETVGLTPTEFKILLKMMKAPGRVFTKAQLYESISGVFFESDENTMMVHISKLREKLEADPKNPEYIKTVRGLGYRVEKH